MMNCEECCDKCEAHDCICVECKHCGESIPPDDMFAGFCAVCDDELEVSRIVRQ